MTPTIAEKDREMTPRPTDAEVAELRRLCDPHVFWDPEDLDLLEKHLPYLLDLVTKEGGDPHRRDEQRSSTDPERDKSPPARSVNAPGGRRFEGDDE